MICDLTVPACEKCIKIGRRCDYGKVRLRWTDCIASRGRLAGKKTPLPLYQPPVLQKTSDHHIMYFENELLPRFNLSNEVPQVDLKWLANDPILLQSVVAVANAHSAYKSANKEALVVEKIQDRNNALRLLRQQLMRNHSSDEANNSLFMANVLLCILDGIIEPITETSATHLHLVGGKAILKQWPGMKGIFEGKHELPILMLSIFATMDLTHAILIGDEPYFNAGSWAEFGGCKAWWGTVRPDDDFLETMGILSQLAALGHNVRHLGSTPPIGDLLSIQSALEQQASRNVDVKPIPTDTEAGWAAFTACYRFSASVFLYRALSSLEVDHQLVQKAVAECIEVMSGDALTDSLHHCILFPVLIVGSHCLVPKQREEIRRSIGKTASYLSFEALRAMSTFLEKRWEELDRSANMRDKNWWEFYQEIAIVTCLF